MALKCVTKGNANPQGKPRVYFCAHPKDYVFFDEIKADVFAKQNCAIYYKDEPLSLIEREDLREMQLILLPVTSRFLDEENVAKEEFFLAQELNIPVLPLAQDSGIENKFNQICGEMQLLDKNNADSTAISYYDKLEKFLSAVLIGDELAEKIRKAFDAYIFLSYRKKDRAFAQELMRLIHKNEFCQDIAIWYDEFLTPGENFNSAIEEALEKSSLFALVVTPNLVNEQNYVETVEYPLARKQGKKVLPAELLPTDREALKEKFDGLDEPTDARDDGIFTAMLYKTVQSLAIKENDRSPEHNFFIGLAYLSGIDVEVDFEKARLLIEKSADSGLPEACAKLAEMYKNGMGVKRDVEKSVYWQEKRVEILKEFYEQKKGTEEEKDALVVYAKGLDAFGDDLCVFGQFARAKQAYTCLVLTLKEYLLKDFDIPLYILQTEGIFGQVTVYGRLGDPKNEKLFLDVVIKRLEDLQKTDGSTLVKKNLARAYKAYIQYANDGRRTTSYYEKIEKVSDERLNEIMEKALALFKEFAEKEGTETARLDLHSIYLEASRINARLRKTEQSAEFIVEAYKIGKELAEETNSIPARRAFAETFGQYATLVEQTKRYHVERANRNEAITRKKALFEETGALCDLDSLSREYQRMMFCCRYMYDEEEAKKYNLLALNAYKKLREMSDSENYKQGFAQMAYRYAENLAKGEGTALFDDIIRMWEECIEKEQSSTSRTKEERLEKYAHDLAFAKKQKENFLTTKDPSKEPKEMSRIQAIVADIKEDPDRYDKESVEFFTEFFGGELEED